MKKILSTLVAVSVLASASVVSAANTYKDTEGHWAEKQINSWSNYGVISGYDGMFSPNRSITRGEFAVVLNRLMNYQDTQKNTFADLDDNFYTDSVLKLNKAGVMQGYEDNISPNANLTRQEAASLICRALGIKGQKTANKTFSDSGDVSSWAQASMNAMINLGLINGADGKLNPLNTITRAEVVTILDNAVLPVLSAGEFAEIETDKILVISADDVVIKDSKINNKVIITQGVTESDIEFIDTEIEGSISIDNDREDFVVLKNTTVDGDLIEEGIYEPGEKEEDKEDIEDEPSKDDKDDEESSQGGGGGGGSNKGDKDDSSDDEPENGEQGGNDNGDDSGDDHEGGNTGDNNQGGNEGGSETPSEPEQPEEPDEPEQPDVPTEPDTPVEPDEPVDPDEPVEPDTPVEPDEPEEEYDANYYLEKNAEMIIRISDASSDMEPYLKFQNQTFTAQEKRLMTIIKNCMDETLKFKDKKIINTSFLKEEFPDEIAEARSIYDEMDAAGLSSAFTEKLVINLNSATIEWLADAFGLLD